MTAPTGLTAWIRERAATPDGVTAAEVGQWLRRTERVGSCKIAEIQGRTASRLVPVRWVGGPLHYFSTQAAADGFLARDPILRVVVRSDSPMVRVAYRGRALDIPTPLARRLMRDLALALG